MQSVCSVLNHIIDLRIKSRCLLSDLIQYIREDSGVLPRAAINTVAGLGGIVAGYRGTKMWLEVKNSRWIKDDRFLNTI